MATGTRKRLLLVAATTGYQTKVFAEVARRLGVEVSLATDRCHELNDPWGDQAIPVRFEAMEESAAALAQGRSFDAVVAVGDRPAYLAALAADLLRVPFHPGALDGGRIVEGVMQPRSFAEEHRTT